MEHRAILKSIAPFLVCGICFNTSQAFDNNKDHPGFNAAIVEQFVSQAAADASNPASKFSPYVFVMNGNATLSGMGVAEAGWTSVNETTMNLTPLEWIQHGGFAADEPEMPAGVRHFYDPLGIDNGKTWLTDISGKLETLIRTNITGDPEIDAKEWAFRYAENRYNWVIGKASFKKALEEPDPKLRAKHMAKAWRCLGEVLHLLADMGLPPHVRNDTHPASGNGAVDYLFGDPSPCESLFKTEYISAYKSRKTETDLKDGFAAAATAEAIFDTLARFTNKNFFSAGTIQGTGSDTYSPLITSRPAYPYPRLQDLDYHPDDFYYYKKFPSGAEVMLCRDLRFIKRRGYPYIDSKCVESMAAVWVPSVITAGKYLMARFIPTLAVTVIEYNAQSGVYRGTVEHTADNEYTNNILYRGPVVITDGSFTVLDTTECSAGYFEGKLKKPGASIGAEISCGGITITGNVAQTVPGDFSLVTKPERVYANMPCTITVVGNNLPKGFGTGFSLIDTMESGGYYSDTSFFSHTFRRCADYRVEATVYYNNSSRIWKVDTFTVAVNDTIIVDSLNLKSAYAGYDLIGIYGWFFGDTGTVSINGKEVPVSSWNDYGTSQRSTILLRTPLMYDTVAAITVSSRNTTSKTMSLAIVPPPKIASIEPAVWQYPNIASIRGSGFGDTATNNDDLRMTYEGEAGSFTFRSQDCDVWTDSIISFKVGPSLRTGTFFIKKKTGASDTIPIKVIPNMALMNSVTMYLSLSNCSFISQDDKSSAKSIVFGFTDKLTSRSSRDFIAQFDSAYTMGTAQYTIARQISFSLDSTLEGISRMAIQRQNTTTYENGSIDIRGDTIVIENIAQPLHFSALADTITSYSMLILNGDSLLNNIKELRSLTYSLSTNETGNQVRSSQCTGWPEKKADGATAYITFDIKR